MHPLVLPSLRAILLLDVAGKVHTLLHVVVLHKLKDDVTFRPRWVEIVVHLLVVGLLRDDAVFALRHFQVFCSAVHTEGVGFRPRHPAFVCRHGVGVDGHEEVGLVAVGNVGASLQRHEHISLSGVDHLHVGTVLLHEFAESQCHVEVDGFLLREHAHGTGILSAVSGIDDQHKLPRGRSGREWGEEHREKKAEEEHKASPHCRVA